MSTAVSSEEKDSCADPSAWSVDRTWIRAPQKDTLLAILRADVRAETVPQLGLILGAFLAAALVLAPRSPRFTALFALVAAAYAERKEPPEEKL